MTADAIDQTGGMFGAAFERVAPELAPGDRNLWIACGVAILLHASFFIGFAASPPRAVGADTGDAEAVAVSLLTEAEFRAQTSAPPVPQAVPGPPAETVAPVAPPPQPAPPPKPEQQATPPETAPPETPPLKDTVTETEPQKAPDTKPSVSALEEKAPELLKLDSVPKADPKPKKAEPAKPAKKPDQQIAKLDDAPAPTHAFRAPPIDGGGRAGAFARPPGITKSGWNDAFAREVIRALQMTMPQMRALGRVTVRIFLDANGNVSEVKVIKPSPDSNLNQSVVFAARQTSYPFPPVGANTADRTFLVTYIYN